MAKSSYEYAVQALKCKVSAEYSKIKEKVVAIFNENDGIYGYRRILNTINNEEDTKIGEWSVRKIMKKRRIKRKSN